MLAGKGGNDILTGGAGNDGFRFDTPLVAGIVTTIVDFTSGSDLFLLRRPVFAAAGAVGPLAPNAFHVGAAAHDASDRIIYNKSAGALYYDADGTGAAAAVKFAQLAAGLGVTHADFHVI